MNKQNSKVNIISIYRAFCILVVASYHFDDFLYPEQHILKTGYVVVDFFFLLSGLLLYKSFKSGKITSPIHYLVSRWEKFAPYCFVLITLYGILFLQRGIRGGNILSARASLSFMLDFYAEELYNLLFLQFMLPSNTALVGVLWYLSDLLWGGVILVILLTKLSEKNRTALLLLLSTFLYIYIYKSYGHLEVKSDATPILCINVGLLRGLAGMSAGCVSLDLAEQMRKMNVVGHSVVRFFVCIVILGIMLQEPFTGKCFYFIPFGMLCLANEFSDEWLQARMKYEFHFERYILSYYIIHMFTLLVWPDIVIRVPVPFLGEKVCFLITVAVMAIIFELLVRFFVCFVKIIKKELLTYVTD